MKKYFLLFLIVSTIGLNAQIKKTESIQLNDDVLMGRWIETERVIDKPSSKESVQTPSILIFKENNMFHKGEDKDGIILFAITGKYRISNDSVTINYYDMSTKYAGVKANKLRRITIKVERFSDNELLLDVTEGHYTKYKALYNRQEIGKKNKTKK